MKLRLIKQIAFAVLLAGAFGRAAAAELTWLTDVPKAQAQARTEHKLVLMDFTGSDWCPWCIKLKNEIFSTPEFKEYAGTNLVPVEVDFPHHKAQSAEQKTANRDLKTKYQIHGFPTVVVLNGDGKEVGRLGYHQGGPKPFIARLEALKRKP